MNAALHVRVEPTVVSPDWRALPRRFWPGGAVVWLELEEWDEDMRRMERGLRESLEESDPYSPLAIERMMLRDAGYEFSRSG